MKSGIYSKSQISTPTTTPPPPASNSAERGKFRSQSNELVAGRGCEELAGTVLSVVPGGASLWWPLFSFLFPSVFPPAFHRRQGLQQAP